jgi:hypothetical protein
MQRMKSARKSLTHYAISGVVVVILGTQTVVSIVGMGGAGWPMISYGMYTSLHYDGERLDHDYLVSAVLEDSSEIEINRDEIGMVFGPFQYNVFLPIKRNDRDALAPIVRDLCRRWNNRIVALRARDLGFAITRQGVIDGLPPVELGRVDVTCARRGPQ